MRPTPSECCAWLSKQLRLTGWPAYADRIDELLKEQHEVFNVLHALFMAEKNEMVSRGLPLEFAPKSPMAKAEKLLKCERFTRSGMTVKASAFQAASSTGSPAATAASSTTSFSSPAKASSGSPQDVTSELRQVGGGKDDIVKRLTAYIPLEGQEGLRIRGALMREAAKEIEFLRAVNGNLRDSRAEIFDRKEAEGRVYALVESRLRGNGIALISLHEFDMQAHDRPEMAERCPYLNDEGHVSHRCPHCSTEDGALE